MSASWFSQWGYWVGPEGQIEPASGFQRHVHDAVGLVEKYGVELPPNPDELPLAEYLALGDAGWVEITTAPIVALGLDFDTEDGMPRRQMEALVRIVREHGKDGKAQFFIDRTDHVGARSAMHYIRGRTKLEVAKG